MRDRGFARRRVLPDRRHEEGDRRFHHGDLEDLAPRRVWAELAVLENWLGARVFAGHRGRRVFVRHGFPLSDLAWVEERVTRLRLAYAAHQHPKAGAA